MPLARLTPLVLSDLPEHTCEDTISPLQSSVVQSTVQLVLSDCLRVDHVALPFHLVSPLHGVHEHLPSLGLAAPRRTNHHQTMVQSLDLIQLQHLLDEALLRLQQHHLRYLHDVFPEFGLSDGGDGGAREDSLEEIGE